MKMLTKFRSNKHKLKTKSTKNKIAFNAGIYILHIFTNLP